MHSCDGCPKSGSQFKELWRCDEDDYDLCEVCYAKQVETPPEELKVARLFIGDFKPKSFYQPLAGKTEITKENILAFAQDFKDNKLTEEVFKSHSELVYDISIGQEGVEAGACLFLVQNYCDSDTKTKNTSIVKEVAKENRRLFHRWFTMNTDDHPGPFIRKEFGMESVDSEAEDKTVPEELKVAQLVVLNQTAEKYYLPLEGKTEITKENVSSLAQDFKDNKLTELTIASRKK